MLDEVAPEGNVFDPGYFMYFEDVDLGWRCRLGGWSATYVPDAIVLHELHGSAEAQAANFVKFSAVTVPGSKTSSPRLCNRSRIAARKSSETVSPSNR